MDDRNTPGGIFLTILGLIVLIVLSLAMPRKYMISRIGLASVGLIYLIYQTVSQRKKKKDRKHDKRS